MEVMILDKTDDIEMIREIGNEWKAASNEDKFVLPIDVNIGLETMRKLIHSVNGDVLVLLSNDNTIKGFIGLIYVPNHIGPGTIVNECCFYVAKDARSKGLKLIHAAEKLAIKKGCDFSTLNASKVAGDAERSGRLYSHCGYVPFETSYIKDLRPLKAR